MAGNAGPDCGVCFSGMAREASDRNGRITTQNLNRSSLAKDNEPKI
jgi:hypothetical protein